jgi:hypothetical protein
MMSLRRAENALGACFSERLVIMENQQREQRVIQCLMPNQRVVALLTEQGYLCEALGGETIKMVGNKVFPVARPADVQQLMEKAKE